MKKTFRDLLSDAINAGASDDEAYESAVSAVGKGDLANHFRPLGIEEVRHMRRLSSRRIENRVFGPVGRRLESRSVPAAVVDVRAILEQATWRRADGAVVNWISATVEDHEARAAEQDRLATTISRDAERHRRAAKLIREVGGETLADVDDLADLADDQSAA